MSYAKDYHQQVKEAFQDPNSKDSVGHSLESGNWVFWKCHQRKTTLKPYKKALYQVFFITDTAVKLEDIDPGYTSRT